MNILSLCRPRALLVALSALLALAGPAHAADPALQIETTPKPPQLAALKSLPSHGKLRINKLQIDSDSGETVDAELQRIEVFMPGAEIIVHGDKGERRSLPPPDTVYFGGKIVGEDDSQVFLAIDGDGATRQIVHRQGSTAVGERKSPNGPQLGALTARTLDPKNDFAHRTFECGASKLTPSFGSRVGALNSSMSYAQLSTATPPTGALTSTQYDVPVVIETDYEYFTKFGSEAAASKYVADLFAYINTAYTSEIRATPKLVKVNIYSTPSDPWTATLADAALYQLRDQWSYVSSPVRAAVHFMSGKTLSGSPYSKSGLAYIGALCINNDGMGGGAYGVSGGIDGSFNPSAPGVVWDALVVAHELGHNFGSYHTFEFDALQNSQNWEGNSSPVDCCYPSGYAGGYCTSANQALPGVGSLSGGPPGVGAGTIMSYCHLMSPGDSNTTLTFGTNHPYGVAPGRVPNAMRRHVEAAQAQYPSCITASNSSPSSYTLSVSKAGSGSGTVTSSPAGINCGSSCSANYSSGTTVTLTATPASGSTFAGWSGACSGTGNCTVTMSAARSVTATFNTAASTSYTLSVSKAGSGSGTVTSNPAGIDCGSSCSANYSSGTTVTLTATPASGSTFAGWSGACSGTGNCTVTMSAARSVTATFNLSSSSSTKLSLNASTSGSVAFDAWKYFYVQTQVPGTLIVSLRNLSNDGDLYVRKGAQPSFSQYDCAPGFAGNSSEVCELSLLADEVVHIGIHGYDATNYTLETAFLLSNTSPFSEKIQKYYIAYYGRPGDLGGIEYWVGRLAAGEDDWSMIPAFGSVDQAEFVSIYGSSGSNSDFLTKAYLNILSRAPDSGGLQFYTNKISQLVASGKTLDAARAQVLIDVVNGVQGGDIALFNNKVKIAQHTSERALYRSQQASALITYVRDVIFKRTNLGDNSVYQQAIADINAFAP